MIGLYWWNGQKGPARSNFGDALSPVLVRELSGREVQFAPLARCDLVAAGSVLNAAQRARGWRTTLLRRPPVRVWGTGTLAAPASSLRGLQVAAVRGPRTRDALGLPAETPLGDPGLLVDRLLKGEARRWRWGIVPHYVDEARAAVKVMAGATPDSLVVDLRDPDVVATARRIAACEFVISSSLHGLITADAFGIPSVWMRLGPDITGGSWKFRDYFESVGRPVPVPVGEATDLRLLEPSADVASRQMVRLRQEELVASFRGLEW